MLASDIDVVSSDVYENGVPYEQFAYLREHAPVFRQRIPHPGLVDEAWVISRYADVRTVSLDTERFSSAGGTTLRVPRSNNAPPGSFISMDDPEHFRLRSLVSKAFTPRVIKTFEHHFREMTVQVIFCLDASLARIETGVMFSELLRRANFRRTGPIRRLQSSFIHGIKELPVEITRLG